MKSRKKKMTRVSRQRKALLNIPAALSPTGQSLLQAWSLRVNPHVEPTAQARSQHRDKKQLSSSSFCWGHPLINRN